MDGAAWVSSGTNLAVALTGIYLAWRAVREIDRWRTQQRETKRADVAAEVLVATIRYIDALVATTLAGISGAHEKVEGDEHAILRAEMTDRWSRIGEFQDAFVKAWQLAEVHLPDSVHELLERISDEHDKIAVNQAIFLGMPIGHAGEHFETGWGSEPKKRLKALRADARALLRPLAQLLRT